MPKRNPPLISAFGHATRIRHGIVTRHAAAIARTTALLNAWGCQDNGYHQTLDARLLPGFPEVAQAEYTKEFAGMLYVVSGYLIRSVDRWSMKPVLYHCDSMVQVRHYLCELRKTKLTDHLPRIFARCRKVTLAMVRRLGWCEPGIRAWWARNAQTPFVERMDVRELMAICRRVANPDHYTTTLITLLSTNPAAVSRESSIDN